MFDILLAFLLFTASVAGHIFYCRKTTKPGLHAKIFIISALLLLFVYAVVAYAVEQKGIFDPHSLWGESFALTAGVIFILLIPIYLCFYTLTQLMSPSKKILLSLCRHESLSYAEILKYVQEEEFIDTRLTDLLTSKCIRQVEGRYVLNASGAKIAFVLNLMQSLLGRGLGG